MRFQFHRIKATSSPGKHPQNYSKEKTPSLDSLQSSKSTTSL